MLKTKRVYEAPSREDGKRILVDGLWPRGLNKEEARIDDWMKEIAPSSELRAWFRHDPKKWEGFKKKFFRELDKHQDTVGNIIALAKKGTVTLLYGAREERFNNATALKEYIETATRASRKKAA